MKSYTAVLVVEPMRLVKQVVAAVAGPVLIGGVLLLLAGCERPVTRPVELSAAEYDVLSAWIAGTFRGEESKEGAHKDIKKVVILSLTWSDDQHFPRTDANGKPIPWEQTASSLMAKAPTLQRTTIDAFRETNAHQALLRRSFHTAIDYELVDSNQLDAISKERAGDPWGAYYRRFPGSQGILSLSRVGFSSDGNQALFYWSNECGGLCGGGSFVLMEKRNGRWTIGREIKMWIS